MARSRARGVTGSPHHGGIHQPQRRKPSRPTPQQAASSRYQSPYQSGPVLSVARRGASEVTLTPSLGVSPGACATQATSEYSTISPGRLGADAGAHTARAVNHADLPRAQRSHSRSDRRLSIPTGRDMLSLSTSVYGPTADQLVCRLLIGLLGNGNGGTLVSGSRLPDSGRFAAPTGWRKNMYRMMTASLFLVASTAFCSAQELIPSEWKSQNFGRTNPN